MRTTHPPGLKTLFFTEMWERFSYYGMRAILQLFMLAPIAAGGMGLPKSESGPIYAMYTSLVYLMSIPGGWLADNIFGQKRSVLYGGVVIMTGHILLALHGTATFYAGLGCVILGTGLLKPNISAIVGQLYEEKDTRREAGFSIFYMGINLGAFLAPLVCGFMAQSATWQKQLESWGLDPRNSWHWGFGAAAVGMFFGLVQYVITGHRLGTAGAQPAPAKDAAAAASRQMTLWIGVGAFVLVGVVVYVLAKTHPELMTRGNINTAYTYLLFGVVIAFFLRLFMAGDWTPGERNRLIVIAVLFAGAAIFWGVFEQAGSTLTIFADESTDNSIFGHAFPSSWWQSLNAVLIVILAPFFAWLWVALGSRNPSYPTKFGIGLAFVGLGFLALVGGARQWTGIWSDYLANNKTAIVAAAEKYEVELPKNTDEIKVGVVSEIVANARAEIETDLWSAYKISDWSSIRALAAKYEVPLDPAKIGLADVSAVISAAKEKIDDEILPPWKRISLIWLFLCYLLHTIGELCLSPVGLAAMTRLAPARVVGLMMGVWFLASSVGNFLGGSVAGQYDKFELPTLVTMVAMSAFVMALIMFALVRPIRKMMAVAEAEKGTQRASGH
jgi:POT family proton-dependent oligopeptide transporter